MDSHQDGQSQSLLAYYWPTRQLVRRAGVAPTSPRWQRGILLLDEPFGALDPGIRADMHELILNLWQKSQLTIFMITHDLKEGFHLGSRLLVFDKLRNDPQAPEAFGASITYDLPLAARRNGVLKEIDESITETARQHEKHRLV